LRAKKPLAKKLWKESEYERMHSGAKQRKM
jgi:hypothetical protein